tara:strand:- start:49645 stop:51165 length:1521 start_codon:yes stop_codon:yes gene_type:complete
MKIEKLPLKLLSILFISIFAFNCTKKDSDETEIIEETEPVTLNNEINDFIWKGLNEIYLWQEDVPNLAFDKFATQDDYYTFLNEYNIPENLFDGLLYQIDVVDKFSYIVDDYVALENAKVGNTNSNGLDFRLGQINGTNDVFGYIRYIANNSDAASKDINRGEFFLEVDGQQLNTNNYIDLLFGDNNTYTIGMADINDGTIGINGKTVALTKTNFTENPILVNKVINAEGIKVGYLMYNQFLQNFEVALNNAFTELKSEGISELVLDLRYNPGGAGVTAVAIASMITGQFEDDIFYKEQWNAKYQAYFEANDPDFLINPFVNTLTDGSLITSLNLNKVYILTTDATASSSELVINGLNAYIDVVQIGTNTTGKFHGSITLYDSPDFGKENINPNHTYAMQPLTIKATNVNGVSDYYDGLVPDYLITYVTSSGDTFEGENIVNMGVLGDINEPFLAKALSLITGNTSKYSTSKKENHISIDFKPIADSKDFTPLGKGSLYSELKIIK